MRADEGRHLPLGGEIEVGGVEPGAGFQERKITGERENPIGVGERLPDAEDGADAGRLCALEDGCAVGVEDRVSQVGVGIDILGHQGEYNLRAQDRLSRAGDAGRRVAL